MKLYTRGKSKIYYIRFQINFKEYRIRLLDLDGNPITSPDKAKDAARRLMAVYLEKDKAEQMRRVKHDIEDAEAAASEASANLANDQATADRAWEIYLSCDGRLQSCQRCTPQQPGRNTTAWLYWHVCDMFGLFLANHGIRRLSDVTKQTAEQYLDTLASANTHGKHLTFLQHLYNILIEERKIAMAANPFAAIRRRPKTPHSKKVLSREQVDALIAAAEGEMKTLFALGYYTGLRLGDCRSLSWSEIHLDRRVIERIPNKTRTRSGAVVKIGIPDALMAFLEKTPPEDRQGKLLRNLPDNDSAVNRQIASVFRAAGIRTQEEGTGYARRWDKKTQRQVSDHRPRALTNYGFHSLRYSYISHNAEAGTPQAVIQKNAGHSNPAMTEHYINISDEAAVNYANSFADADGAELRRRLRSLAMSLPIDDVRRILDIIDGKQE